MLVDFYLIREHLKTNACFEIVDLFETPDEKFDAFRKILVDIIDSIAPVKRFRLKGRPNFPWFDKELYHLTAKRDIAHQIAIKSGDNRD